MRTSLLLPFAQLSSQGGVLAQLYLHPETEYSLSDLDGLDEVTRRRPDSGTPLSCRQ